MNLERAKKQGLCFNCGKKGLKGHQAKNCRLKKNVDKKPKEATMRAQMLRYETGSVSSRTLSEGNSEFEDIFEDDYKTKQLEVTAALEGLHLGDLDTDGSDGEISLQEP